MATMRVAVLVSYALAASAFQHAVPRRAPDLGAVARARALRGAPAAPALAPRRTATGLAAPGAADNRCSDRASSHRARTRLQASTTLELGDDVPTPLQKLSGHPVTKVLCELWRMTRPLTIPAEVGLALGGSLLAAKAAACLAQPLVWLVAFFSAVTGAGSMVINDYFDHRAGVDRQKPKPLTVGTVHPEQALLASTFFYTGALFMAAILLQDFTLRALVSTSLMVTLLYTPLLKAIPLVKNAVVAFIISQAVVAGGLATGSPATLPRTLLPAFYIFCTIMWQEIMMDINDVEGDRRGGIVTLPVALGKHAAMAISLGFLSTAAAAPLLPLIAGSWAPASELGRMAVGARCALLVPIAQLPLVAGSIAAWRGGMEEREMKRVLDWCFPAIALAISLMAWSL